MKSAIFILALLIGGLFISGCSGTSNEKVQAGQKDATNTDITQDLSEQPMNPDIGELDDIPVSEGLPQ